LAGSVEVHPSQSGNGFRSAVLYDFAKSLNFPVNQGGSSIICATCRPANFLLEEPVPDGEFRIERNISSRGHPFPLVCIESSGDGVCYETAQSGDHKAIVIVQKQWKRLLQEFVFGMGLHDC
jgi:hypothetical protein